MQRVVDAIYDGGVFRPLTPMANMPDRTAVRLVIELGTPRRTAADTASNEIEARIAELERLGDAAFGALTPIDERALREARLDQQHFFDHPNP